MPAARTALLGDRFAPADPGLLRLTAGLRAVLGLALTLAVLAGSGQPPQVVLVGGFTVVVTSLGISDLLPRNQFRTLAAGLPVTLGAVTAGALLAPFPVAARVAFLLLIFTAVYVRRFEPRGQDLGIFAFMAFFLTQFARIRPSQLPELAGALGIAFAAAAVTRFCLVRTPTSATLGRLRAAYDTSLRDVLRASMGVLTEGRTTRGGPRGLERRLGQLRTSALLIQDFLREGDAKDFPGAAPAVVAEIEWVAATEAHARRLAAGALRLTGATGLLAYATNESSGSAKANLLHHLGNLLRAAEERSHGLSSQARTVTSRIDIPHTPTACDLPATETGGLRRHTTRQAVQVTTAAAFATLGGQLLSPELWYWAVATTWVVFVNTENTGDILLQSGRRLIGTVAGVLFGYGLALLAAGHPPWALAALLICVFGMFYTPSDRYWAVTFFITGSLSMVLELLHRLSSELLVLRIQETALGVVCGVLAAVLVMPTTARRIGDDRLRDFLHVLNHAVRRTVDGLDGAAAGPRPVPTPVLIERPELGDVDRALIAFRNATRPLTHPLNPRRTERARALRVLELLEAGAFHARRITTHAAQAHRAGEPAASTGAVAAARRAIDTLDLLAHELGRGHGPFTKAPGRYADAGATGLKSAYPESEIPSPAGLTPSRRLLLHAEGLDAAVKALASSTLAIGPISRSVASTRKGATRPARL
ncbi:FUSC family protein [Streptomyces niveus]